MIIAVNTRFLIKHRLEGIGRFSYEILKRITNNHKENTFIFFFDRKVDESFLFSDNIIPIVLFPQARHPLLWYFFFEFSVTRALKKYHADLFITMDGFMSLGTNIKTLQVLHDLHYKNHPSFLPKLVRNYYQHFFPKFIHKADRIITVSHFCKQEITETYGIKESNIDVVYNSSRDEYHALSETEISMVKAEYTQGQDYFLFIGPIHPRKNLGNVIKAFIRYKQEQKTDMKLIVTGNKMWRNFNEALDFHQSVFKSDIIFTGHLTSKDLFKVTAAATCLLYVSFYEGFGMPILEAMSCDVPVITSGVSAMPEIAGDAAIFIDPHSSDSIFKAIIKIQTNTHLKKDLIMKGRENIKRFSWDISAQVFWQNVIKTIEK